MKTQMKLVIFRTFKLLKIVSIKCFKKNDLQQTRYILVITNGFGFEIWRVISLDFLTVKVVLEKVGSSGDIHEIIKTKQKNINSRMHLDQQFIKCLR